MNDQIFITWDEIHDGCKNVADLIVVDGALGVRVDAVVGLSRGGLVPGVLLSHLLDAPLIPVDYSSTRGKGDNMGSHSNDVQQIRQHNLLLVDDIADTGHTLSELDHLLRERGHAVYTYVHCWKEGSALTPDWHCVRLEHDAPWVVFPWE